jgi:hypothetical protein
VAHLKTLKHTEPSHPTNRHVETALRRLQRVGNDPRRAARMLNLAAIRLRGRNGTDPDLLSDAALMIAERGEIFRRRPAA